MWSFEQRAGATAELGRGRALYQLLFHSTHPWASAATGSQGLSGGSRGPVMCLHHSGQSFWLSYDEGCSTNTDACPSCPLAKIPQNKMQFPLPKICSSQKEFMMVRGVRPKQ